MKNNMSRATLRAACWVALVVCAGLGGAVGEYMISGGHLIYFDEQGRILPRPPLTFADWLFVAGLLITQALLITMEIQLRKTSRTLTLFPHNERSETLLQKDTRA